MTAIAAKIMSKITADPATGCWNWTGGVHSERKPYGIIHVGSRKDGTRGAMRAHRASYEAFVGPIPDGLAVCHHCDNPRCVNPQHLFVGTWKDNADDRDAKGRNIPPPLSRGEAHPSTRFTDELVAAIRASSLNSLKAAPIFGVSNSYIRQLRRGEWRRPSPPKDPAHD